MVFYYKYVNNKVTNQDERFAKHFSSFKINFMLLRQFSLNRCKQRTQVSTLLAPIQIDEFASVSTCLQNLILHIFT